MKKRTLLTKVARALRGGSRGMTLIEVVVALALLGIIAVTFLGGLTAAARAALLADIRTTAESLARAQMEDVKRQGYNSTLVDDGHATYAKLVSIPPGYAIWSIDRDDVEVSGTADDPITAIPWDSENDQPVPLGEDDMGLQKIKLVVKHENKAIFTLEGYKMDR